MKRTTTTEDLRKFLDRKLAQYGHADFIKYDPIQIPHQFRSLQDIEIAGFFAAIFAWGNRTTIILKTNELMRRMDQRPHAFCIGASARELRRLEGFVHRTFRSDDLFYFIQFFRQHYAGQASLESAFARFMLPGDDTIENALIGFRSYFFSGEHLTRTEKHIASPLQQSACKRLNMFLRWMVRRDAVDFGLWKEIHPRQLVCPLDLHVHRVARQFGLVEGKSANWTTALELTAVLRGFDPEDPVKYDLALFSLGQAERY